MAKRYKEDEKKNTYKKKNLNNANKKPSHLKEDKPQTYKATSTIGEIEIPLSALNLEEKTKKNIKKEQKNIEKEKNKKVKKIKKEEEQKKKAREKAVREKKKQMDESQKFDFDTETVIGMTQKKPKEKNAIPKKLTKKQKEELKKKKRRMRILKIFLFIILVGGLITFAMVSPIFNIESIEVENNAQVPTDTIVSLSGLSNGQNIFRFLSGSIKNNIKQNAYIENVEIKRELPNKIKIQVEERIKKFAIPTTTQFAQINTQGYIMDVAQEIEGLPTIVGFTTSEQELVAGNRLNNEDLENLEVILKIMDVCKDNELDTKVTSIDITTENEYSIEINSENKKIYLGDKSNISNKLRYAKAILDQTQGKAGEIFVNGDLNDKFKPYFREQV